MVDEVDAAEMHIEAEMAARIAARVQYRGESLRECEACGENPEHAGDCHGNEFRWQDYRVIAQAAIDAYEAF